MGYLRWLHIHESHLAGRSHGPNDGTPVARQQRWVLWLVTCTEVRATHSCGSAPDLHRLPPSPEPDHEGRAR
jgi:hypothetical protein